MSAPRIRVKLIKIPVVHRIGDRWMRTGFRCEFMWACIGGGHSAFDQHTGARLTIAAAADAGLEHLRTAHLLPRLREALVTAPGYSRRCGVSLAACAANRCEYVQAAAQSPEALGDPDGPKVAQILAMRPHSGDYGPLHRSHNEGIRR